MTAIRKISFFENTFVEWMGQYYGGAAIATSINVGAKISLSGDGEISAPNW